MELENRGFQRNETVDGRSELVKIEGSILSGFWWTARRWGLYSHCQSETDVVLSFEVLFEPFRSSLP